MSEHVAGMIADCEAKIGQLTDIVEKLRWFQREFPHTAAAIVPVEKSRRKYTRKTKAAKKNDRQTDRQTEQSPGPHPRAHLSLPDGAKLQAIVGVLNKHGGSMKPGMLADAPAIDLPALRYQMKPFLASGALMVTGATLSRLVHVGKPVPTAPKPNGLMKPSMALDEVEARDRNVLLLIKGAGVGGRSMRELAILLGEPESALTSSIDRLRIKKQIQADDNGKWVSA